MTEAVQVLEKLATEAWRDARNARAAGNEGMAMLMVSRAERYGAALDALAGHLPTPDDRQESE